MSAAKPTLVEQVRHTKWTVAELKKKKLDQLVSSEGYQDTDAFLQDFALESVVPGACMNPSCEFEGRVEPDAEDNWCESCGVQSVCSSLILAGIC